MYFCIYPGSFVWEGVAKTQPLFRNWDLRHRNQHRRQNQVVGSNERDENLQIYGEMKVYPPR